MCIERIVYRMKSMYGIYEKYARFIELYKGSPTKDYSVFRKRKGRKVPLSNVEKCMVPPRIKLHTTTGKESSVNRYISLK